ncbi:hypothetical protein HZS_66, partial [Henneguya salminicola]
MKILLIFLLCFVGIISEGWMNQALRDIASRYIKKTDNHPRTFDNFLQKLVTTNAKRNKVHPKKGKNITKNDNPVKDLIFEKLNKFSKNAFVHSDHKPPGEKETKSEEEMENKHSKDDKSDNENDKISKPISKHKKKSKKHRNKKETKEKSNIKTVVKKEKSMRKTLNKQLPRFRREVSVNNSSEIKKMSINNDRYKRNSVKRVLKEEYIVTTVTQKPPNFSEIPPIQENGNKPEYTNYCFNKLLNLHYDIFSQYGLFRNSRVEDRSNISNKLYDLTTEFWKEYNIVASSQCSYVLFKPDEMNVFLKNNTIILPTFPEFDFSYYTGKYATPVIDTPSQLISPPNVSLFPYQNSKTITLKPEILYSGGTLPLFQQCTVSRNFILDANENPMQPQPIELRGNFNGMEDEVVSLESSASNNQQQNDIYNNFKNRPNYYNGSSDPASSLYIDTLRNTDRVLPVIEIVKPKYFIELSNNSYEMATKKPIDFNINEAQVLYNLARKPPLIIHDNAKYTLETENNTSSYAASLNTIQFEKYNPTIPLEYKNDSAVPETTNSYLITKQMLSNEQQNSLKNSTDKENQ